MSQDTPIPLVPGDNWEFDIDTPALDLTGFTVLKRSVTSGTVSFDVDVSFSPGVAHVTAGHAVTAALRMGNVSILTIQVQSPDAKWTTVIVKHINGVRIQQAFQAASTSLIGLQGPLGINWRDDLNSGNWVTGGAYGIRDGVYNDGTSYRATAAHTASALNEPGIGANWQDFWDVIALGANEAEVGIVAANIGSIIAVGDNIGAVNTVAGSIGAVNIAAALDDEIIDVASIAAQIVTTASISVQIQTVATNMASVVTVAASITGLDAIAANLPAVLDASNQATAAANSAANALTYSLSASAYNDQANAYQQLSANYASNASASLAAMAAALANVTNYDNTLGQLKGAAKQIVAAADVVAATVYDTAKDSDGGIWRWRARGPWFYEALGTATRGTRQFFPKRALIVWRAASMTIYDLDDSACPMWKVFNRGGTYPNQTALGTAAATVSCGCAMNGVIWTGFSNYYYSRIDFLANEVRTKTTTGGLIWTGSLGASDTVAALISDGSITLANVAVNSICATIYPGTPIDPLRKLPTPTLGAGTGLGVSIVHWDGRIANSANTGVATLLSFGSDGSIRWWINSSGVFVKAMPSAYAITGFAFTGILGSGGVPRLLSGAGVSASPNALGQATGLQIFGDAAVPAMNYIAAITSKFNTGRLYGSTVLALAESTADVTSLVSAGAGGYGAEIITDPTFSTSTDWTFLDGTAISIAGGVMVLNAGGTDRASFKAGQQILTPGKRYKITFDITASTANFGMRIRFTPGSGSYGYNTIRQTAGSAPLSSTYWTAVGSYSLIVEPLLPTPGYFYLDRAAGHTGSVTIDNFSLQEVTLANDRSSTVNNNSPIVMGTVLRAAVATGAELAAYGGFSNLNYLATPGQTVTDEFCMTMWVSPSVGLNRTILDARDTFGTQTTGFLLSIASNIWNVNFGTVSGANQFGLAAPTAFSTSDWQLINIVFSKSKNRFELWTNDKLVATAAVSSATVPFTIPAINIGKSNASHTHLISQPRFGLSAPTPTQIRAMYAAETPMFQPGAKCLLTGSDSVQAIGDDDGTGLRYVSNAVKGTDVFNGLIRQSSINIVTENAVGAEIAVNGAFAADTNWSKGTNCTISGGTANFAAAPNSNGFTQTAATLLTAGKSYLVTYDVVSIGAGGVRSAIGAGIGVTRLTAGSYQEIVVAGATQSAGIITSGVTTAVVDNFSFKEITALRLGSDNHKGVVATNDNIAIFTDADCYMKTPSISLREAMDTAIGRPADVPVYDRTYVLRPSAAVTTNATPTVVGYLPMDKGEAGTWVIRATAREYGEPAAPELASYEVRVTAARPQEGNIALSGSPTYTIVSETTGTMDVTVAANTTVQALAITATGPAGKNVEWGYEATFVPSVQQVAA